MKNLKWKGRLLTTLNDHELSQALDLTLQILRAMLEEQQRRANEVRRKATQKMLAEWVRVNRGVPEREPPALLPPPRPVSRRRRAAAAGRKRAKRKADGGKGGGSSPRAA